MSIYYQPRYLPGSPADVELNRINIEREMRREHESYEHHVEGIYGPENAAFAKTKGLRGIAVESWFVGKVKKFRDLMTGEEWVEKPEEAPAGREHPVKIQELRDAAKALEIAWKTFDQGALAGTPMERANLCRRIEEVVELIERYRR